MKIFISIPMKGFSDEVVENRRQAIMKQLFPNDKLIDSFTTDPSWRPIDHFCHAVSMIPQADLVVFTYDYANAGGCVLEKNICDRFEFPTRVLTEKI